MSHNEDFILPDGRKTSELKHLDLKIELEKIGKYQGGSRSELVTRLNEALSANTYSVDDNHKESPVTRNELKVQRTKYRVRKIIGVDLDDSDDMRPDGGEINQSMDTIELSVPHDDSLNPLDDIVQEDQIQVRYSCSFGGTITSRVTQINLSRDEEAEMIMEVKDDDHVAAYTDGPNDERIVICDKEMEEEKSDLKRSVIENEPEEMLNIEIDPAIDMYEGDGMDLEVGARNSKKKKKKKDREIITVTVINEGIKSDNFDNLEETEEGEVVTVPISARLGKRKIKEEKLDCSPKKGKVKEQKEANNMGHLIEEPFRVKSPQRSKNIISDILRVDHLVRPFTMIQLQDVLSMRGNVVDLWLNRIKSIAYVRYENESTAINARENLDGCKWPSINPKLLVVDFATCKEMEWMKQYGDTGLNPPANLRHAENPKRINDIESCKQKQPELPKPENKERRIHEKRENNHDSKPHRSHSVEKKRHHGSPKRLHREKGREKAKEKPELAPAAKLLEDLFKKTVAQPSIYWLSASKDKKEEETKISEWRHVASL